MTTDASTAPGSTTPVTIPAQAAPPAMTANGRRITAARFGAPASSIANRTRVTAVVLAAGALAVGALTAVDQVDAEGSRAAEDAS